MDDAPRITPEELFRRMSAGEPIVALDVRRGSYDRSDVKIEGALRIEPDALDDEFEQIPAGSEVATYCT